MQCCGDLEGPGGGDVRLKREERFVYTELIYFVVQQKLRTAIIFQ